jgi:AhpC/TSA family/Thiol:disulfide interchange protein DsbD, N-terminal
VELQSRVADIRKAGLGLAAISYDPQAVLASFSARRGITFPLLSDPGSETITRYGILNTTVDSKDSLFGYPFPGTFIVDRQGVVTARFFEKAYQERDTVSSILVRLGQQIDVQATRISGSHVTLTSYATDQIAAQGTHFSLVLDVAPAPHVHVYAPGATNYRPVTMSVESQPGLVLRAPQYPTSEDYFFKPLKEHVPVYQHPFRVVQDVTLDPSRDGTAVLKDVTSLTITGRFEYQACDDKVCFPPQSVPLSWPIRVKPLDRERSKQD